MKNELSYEKIELRKQILLIMLSFIVLIWTVINNDDYFAWFCLMLPSVIYVFVLAITYKKFKFTTFAYFLVFIHIVIMLIGAKYTYTYNPLFEQLKTTLNFSRNHYDRIGHIAQGFIPVILIKEFILRKGYMTRSKFFYLIVISFVLAISACWELIEFSTVLVTKKPASYVLSTQGDVWDTQWDMIMATLGAILALLTLGKFHDKKMDEIEKKSNKSINKDI